MTKSSFAVAPKHGLALLFLLQPHLLQAQKRAPGENSGQKPEFAAVSVRPERKDGGISYTPSPDGFEAAGQNLISLILMAYLPMPLRTGERVSKEPDWAFSETYTIRAKVAAENLPAWQGEHGQELFMAMMQRMLAERFQLRVHTEPMEMTGYALVRVREAPYLRVVPPGEVLPKYTPLSHGVVQSVRTPGGVVMTFYGVTMKSLAGFLTLGAHTIVEDRTGLEGDFDFDLRYTGTGRATGEATDPAKKWDFSPLGLKTVPTKFPSVRIIVDHAEHPSPN